MEYQIKNLLWYSAHFEKQQERRTARAALCRKRQLLPSIPMVKVFAFYVFAIRKGFGKTFPMVARNAAERNPETAKFAFNLSAVA